MRALIIVVSLAAAGCGRKSGPSCAEVANHVQGLFGGERDTYATDLRGVFAARCEQDRWTSEMRACVAGTTSLSEPRNCKQKLTPEQTASFEGDLTAAENREAQRAVPVACVRYERMLSDVMTCEVLSKEVRDSLQSKFETFKATWPSVADKRSLEAICASAVGVVRSAASQCPGAAKW